MYSNFQKYLSNSNNRHDHHLNCHKWTELNNCSHAADNIADGDANFTDYQYQLSHSHISAPTKLFFKKSTKMNQHTHHPVLHQLTDQLSHAHLPPTLHHFPAAQKQQAKE